MCVYSGLEGESTTRHSKMAKYRSIDDQDHGANEEKSRVIIASIYVVKDFTALLIG